MSKYISALEVQHLKNYLEDNGLANDINYLCDEFGIVSIEALPIDEKDNFIRAMIDLRRENSRLKTLY